MAKRHFFHRHADIHTDLTYYIITLPDITSIASSSRQLSGKKTIEVAVFHGFGSNFSKTVKVRITQFTALSATIRLTNC